MPQAPKTIMQTKLSTWTPLNHQLSNAHFEKWTDSQRKQVLQDFFSRCSVSQLKHLRQTLSSWVPEEALDFTKVLPRVISLYIFSFLDPRSLCRCAQVSWHWKNLAELDQLWMPKCLKLGWCITFTPTPFEQGVWKRHYIETVQELHISRPKFGSLGYTIMGKTADLTVVQKTVIDTLHKEGKPQTFVAKEAGCSQSAVSKHVNRKLSGRKKCGRKRCTTNQENRSLERLPLLNHRQRQGCLTSAKEKKKWPVAQWSKVLFSDESKFCISFGNQGPRGAMSSAGVGPLCFLKTKVTAPVYQEILEQFMLPSADQLFKDADFILQQDLAPAHTAKKENEKQETKNADELKATVKETWASIPPHQCHRPITSMPRQIEAVPVKEEFIVPEVKVVGSKMERSLPVTGHRELKSVLSSLHGKIKDGNSLVKSAKGLPPWRDSDRHPTDTIRFNYLDNLDPVENARKALIKGKTATIRQEDTIKAPSRSTYKLRKAKSLMFLSLDLSAAGKQNQNRPQWAAQNLGALPANKESIKRLSQTSQWNAGIRPGPVRPPVPRLSKEGLRASQRSHRSTPNLMVIGIKGLYLRHDLVSYPDAWPYW
ncbi:F-box only protein 16 [Labeo rohita]|uniref:F-box only protein 16 n=1 Tax=Labeo rohita TaxID=84645 RepID=A0ABQ8LN87_LABRO|nr:F-box only protein 16 [Labeo rohita]